MHKDKRSLSLYMEIVFGAVVVFLGLCDVLTPGISVACNVLLLV